MQQRVLRGWLHVRTSDRVDVRLQHGVLWRRAGAELCAMQGVQSQRDPLQPLHGRQPKRYCGVRVQRRVLRQRVQLQAL